MKALSVRQPYATDICLDMKTIELRTWRTDYRGKLLICSSKTGIKTWLEYQDKYYFAPMGATICVVDLIDCRPATKDDADDANCPPDDITDGMWAWVLDNVIDVKPKPIRGKLNLFEVDDSLVEPCGEPLYHEFLEQGIPSFDKDDIIFLG
ncbi:ASCH domain-containing protein [Moraxella sp. ZJ142]|uniref:ASCH domain-containing protein n=1 Tax=Moraxella marmotae TaxID=3344520 RepID=UPI0035D452A8